MDVLADRYELGATLGAGGMARVVQAHDRLLDREVAVKLLRDDIAMDPSARERFLREARTAARFNHPNAVAVYDTGQDGRQPWIVMELVRGEDLAQRLAHGGALDESEAVRITDAVLSALGAAHRDGMVHRDVKPANIMLLDDGGVKLADFGIAKSVQDATAGITATGQIIGTAKYLSPEQVEGRPATPASDVYATGVVLYEMLAGEAPYTGDSAIAVALAHTREPVPDIAAVRRGVSPALAAVVERAMAKDPAARYADAEEMRRALAGQQVAAAPVAAAPTAVLERDAPTRVLRERPAPAPRAGGSGWIWALLLVGLAAIGGALLLNTFDGGSVPADTETEEPAEDDKPADEPTEEPAEEEPEPTEPPAPESPAPPEEEPETEAPPIPEPTDIESLITFLDANPDRYGPRQKDLRKELDKVNKGGGPKQAEAASQLSEMVVSWAEDGELDVAVAEAALIVLAPIASQEFGEGEGGGKGEGEGEGRGKNKEDED